MRMIFILILTIGSISCGKHTEPRPENMNNIKVEWEKKLEDLEIKNNVSEFNAMGKVSGEITFFSDKEEKIYFSNELSYNTKILNMLTDKIRSTEEEEYLQETSIVDLKGKNHSIILEKPNYVLYFNFYNPTSSIDEVVMRGKKGFNPLGEWSPNMKIKVSSEHLKRLLEGELSFVLINKLNRSRLFLEKSDEKIKDKTYRVYFQKGNSEKILFISKSLSFKKFQQILNIESCTIVKEDDLFFENYPPGNYQWFTREYDSGRKILTYRDISHLQNIFLGKI
jgi:hypothetical protein